MGDHLRECNYAERLRHAKPFPIPSQFVAHFGAGGIPQ